MPNQLMASAGTSQAACHYPWQHLLSIAMQRYSLSAIPQRAVHFLFARPCHFCTFHSWGQHFEITFCPQSPRIMRASTCLSAYIHLRMASVHWICPNIQTAAHAVSLIAAFMSASYASVRRHSFFLPKRAAANRTSKRCPFGRPTKLCQGIHKLFLAMVCFTWSMASI